MRTIIILVFFGSWYCWPGFKACLARKSWAGFWNVTAFGAGARGAFGNEGRNALYGPGQYNLDMSLFKTARITARARAEFPCELFNTLNHPSPGDPNTSLSSSSFGKITSATAPRIMQLGMKILF